MALTEYDWNHWGFTKRQIEFLLRGINPKRVLVSQGQSHLPAFDVEAHLTRVFGFEGWDREILDLWLIHETPNESERDGKVRVGWTVTYGCKLRLKLRNPQGVLCKTVDGAATGSANNLPSRGDAHDFAMKNADSYALKRAAKALADQFGLSLYNKGMTEALVRKSAAYEDAPSTNGNHEDVPVPLSMGNDERADPPETLFAPPSVAPHTGELMSESQRKRIFAVCNRYDLDPHERASVILCRPIDSLKGLLKEEAKTILDTFDAWERDGLLTSAPSTS